MDQFMKDAKLALDMEKEGYKFYCETAQKTNNPLAKATFEGLAKREQEHAKRIKELSQEISGEKKLPGNWLKEVEVAPDKKALLKPILQKLKSALNQKFETTEEINKAYEIAKGLEKDGYNLYDKIAREAEDEKGQKLFLALAQEEREHFSILDETLQYLNTPGDWFKDKERWIVEG